MRSYYASSASLAPKKVSYSALPFSTLRASSLTAKKMKFGSSPPLLRT